jgi:glycosyltransferase involved in cell wall biosynthesis
MGNLNFSVLCSLYYKESPYALRESLDSIFAQTLMPNEVVIVKDGPLTDELEKVLEDYAGRYDIIKIVPLEKNVGLGAALNEGMKHCSYELIARMDTDDIAKENRFEEQIKVFKETPELDVVGAWIDEFEGDISNVTSIRKLPENHDEIFMHGRDRCPINHPVVMFKKSAVISAGGYKHFYLFEDYYLWVRMLVNNAKFYNIQKSLLYFRLSPDMFQRRGGLKYARSEAKFEKAMYDLGYISFFRMSYNIIVRFIVRIMPNGLREWVYKKVIRK